MTYRIPRGILSQTEVSGSLVLPAQPRIMAQDARVRRTRKFPVCPIKAIPKVEISFQHMKRKATTQKKKKTVKRSRTREYNALAFTPRAELKFVDVLPTILGTPIATGWTNNVHYFLLNGTELGDDFFNRNGRKISMQNLKIRIQIFPNGSTAVADFPKIAIVYDRQGNGLAPSNYAELFTSVSATAASSSTAMDMQRRDFASRYFVLREWDPALPETLTANTFQAGPADGNKDIYSKTWDVDLKGLMVQYNSVGMSNILSIETGHLYLVVQGMNGTFGYHQRFVSRLAYYDL